MTDLIARLVSIAEPDRDLDLAIINVGAEHPWRWHKREDETITNDRYGPGAVGNPVCALEHFTGSIDDAMTLVPDGLMVTMTILGGKAAVSVKTGSIINPETKEWQACGFTPAAISAAALRARAALAAKAKPPTLPEGFELFDGKPMKVLNGDRSGWWRFHNHYDRDGYCDNPGRGY